MPPTQPKPKLRGISPEPERYRSSPSTSAQAGCPHRVRNKANTECMTCGSKKLYNRWWYLHPDLFHAYTQGRKG